MFLFVFSGCSSGGSGGDDSDDGNYPNIVVSEEERTEALTSASAAFENLTDETPEEASEQMAEYLKAQPEFEDAGLAEDGSAWARFKDGRLAIFVNTRTQVTNPPKGKKSITPPSDLPGGTESRVADNLGERYGDPYSDITPWLEDAGYAPSLPGNLTDMTSMGSLGLLVISSHGGSGEWRDKTTAFAIWGTAFDVAPNKDEEYKHELDDRRLCYMYADTGDGDNTNNQWRYAFTAKYVMEYMNFTKGSMVFMDACSSNDPVMRAAFLAKGASVYVGWSAPVNSGKACITAKYLFDRLLGANKYNAETPKQRPFDWKSVFIWMQENGYDIGQDAGGCYLQMTEAAGNGNGFGLLAPSIQFMFAHAYDEELYLYGLFGDNPGNDGKVTVNGTQHQIKEWKRDSQTNLDRIICYLPFEGGGSSGDVKVTVRKHESNVRQLSLYKGDVKFTHDSGDGRYFEINHHLRFRADLQSFRTKPGEAPVFSPANPQYVYADDLSDAEFKAEGVTDLGDDGSAEWIGQSDMVNNINGQESSTSFIATIQFDPANMSARLMLSGVIANGITQIIKDENGATVLESSLGPIYGNDSFDGKEGYFPSYVEFDIGADYGLPMVERQAQTVAIPYALLNYGSDTVTISFEAIACQSPPDPEASR